MDECGTHIVQKHHRTYHPLTDLRLISLSARGEREREREGRREREREKLHEK